MIAQSWESLVTRRNVSFAEALVGSAACISLPSLLRLAMTPALGTTLPYSTYFPAVLLATILWGARWGTAVLVTSGLVAGYLFTTSISINQPSGVGLAALALFICAGGVVIATGLGLRRALIKLHAAQEAELLRKSEMQHRLKNTIAIVQSFALFLSRKASDPADFYQRLETRLQALATASDMLFAGHFETCALPHVAEAALAAFAHDGRLVLAGPPQALKPESCEPLMLALHELATNAHKYGALSVPTGSVELSWQTSTEKPPKCVLHWTEKGGPQVRPPVRSGLGSRLLKPQRGLDDVTIAYEPSGVICALTVPVTAG